MFLLALGFIYLVLAAQFESFRDPAIILLTVPLSMTGALGALWLTGGTLNVFSQIGLVTLVGLITKHGILIVEFANQQQEQGRDRLSAVIEAAGLRLRPILMTTGAMVLGALPLALASGAGAESRQQIGWVIVGGMTLRHFVDAVRYSDGLQHPRTTPWLERRRCSRHTRDGGKRDIARRPLFTRDRSAAAAACNEVACTACETKKTC